VTLRDLGDIPLTLVGAVLLGFIVSGFVYRPLGDALSYFRDALRRDHW
jgi:hypothetical protein